MQKTNLSRVDYSSYTAPLTDTRSISEQAATLYASVRVALKDGRAEPGEFNRGYFDQNLAWRFNRNAGVSKLRTTHRPMLMDEARKAFYNFIIALKELEISASIEVRNAVLTIIANELLNKPVAAPQTSCPGEEPHASVKISPAQDLENLDSMRNILLAIRSHSRKPIKPLTQDDLNHGLLRAEVIIAFTRKALGEKRVNVMGQPQKYFADSIAEAFNRSAELISLRAEKPALANRVEKEFRHIKIAAKRLDPKISMSEPVELAIISLLAHEAKEKAAGNLEKLQDHARKIGRSAASRAAASETLSAIRDDPVKAAEHNKRASERIKKLYEDPEDKSGFRKSRKTSFSQQQRDSNGHFIKAEVPALISE